jgi:CRISPR/Cas system-associated exonuclease Cas4 (RecB family)
VTFFRTALERSQLSAVDFAAYCERGEKALRAYHKTYAGTFTRDAETEVHIRAELPLLSHEGRVTLHGFIDKLERLPNGTVRVIDYKTGTPKSRSHIEGKTKDSDGDYKRQLVFYKLLLDVEGKHRMSEGVIDFVEPNERGINKREAFTITDEEVAALRADIERMRTELVNGTFIPTTSASEDAEVRALAALLSKRFS